MSSCHTWLMVCHCTLTAVVVLSHLSSASTVTSFRIPVVNSIAKVPKLPWTVVSFRLHCSTSWIWPVAADGISGSVGRSVCLYYLPCKHGWTDWDSVWDVDFGESKEPCFRWGPDPHIWSRNFECEKGLAQDMSEGRYTQSDSERGSMGLVVLRLENTDPFWAP